ncbi:Holliday junction branch migration protein RuvA [Rhodothermaceae bacterium RA]|nr:Holliday junction branch migration protein RuvA [Rhodothermaceae bacterium RA]
MIAYVSGTLIEKKPTEALVEVNGIGYRVLIPTSTFETLPNPGEAVRLLTHFYVREDTQALFGFATKAERAVFEVMLGVSGVGPKLALAALSALGPAELRARVVDGDAGMLTNIPGVGKKTAERLIVELRDRLANLDLQEAGAAPLSGGSEARAAARADALAALESLGLSRAAAEKNLRKVLRTHPGVQSAEELVRLALREA